MEGLTLNPESPLWAGRNLPGIPATARARAHRDSRPGACTTRFSSCGISSLTRPSTATSSCATAPSSTSCAPTATRTSRSGIWSAHTYELRTVRVGDGWRSAGVTATATAQTDEATIRANHDAAFLGHQTAAMARNAATEIFTHAADRPAFRTGARRRRRCDRGPAHRHDPGRCAHHGHRFLPACAQCRIQHRHDAHAGGSSTVSRPARCRRTSCQFDLRRLAILPTASTIERAPHVLDHRGARRPARYTYQLRLDVDAQPERGRDRGMLHYRPSRPSSSSDRSAR